LLKEIYPKLPFAFSSLADEIGVKKSTMRNYNLRKIPKEKQSLLKEVILKKLILKLEKINEALTFIKGIKEFGWDVVESVEVINYDDFVYDFIVPEGHSFIGGNMPTIMHNTQLGLTLAVNVQLPIDKGGANGKSVFIDTEGTFRPARIKQIAEGLGANSEKVLKNIFVARAFNSLPGSEKVYILNDNEFHKENIESVVNGRKEHKILTFAFDSSGKMQPTLVTNLISHYVPENESIYTLKTKFGREISVTGSHSLFKGVRKGKKGATVRREKGNMRPEAVEVSSLNIGDHIAIPKFLPMIEKDVDKFKIINKFPDDIKKEIKIVDCGIKLVCTGKHKALVFSKHVSVDEDLLWLLGFAIAEGNSQYKDRLVRVRLSSEIKYLKKAQRIIKEKFGLDTHLHEKVYTLLISSRLFSLVLKYVFDIRVDKKSPEREIPGWIMQLPLKKLKHFIKGYWDGDGYHAESARKRRLIFHTSSRELANDVSLALLRFGVLSSIFEIKLDSRKDYKDYWSKHYRVEAAGLSSNDILNLENVNQNLNAPVFGDLVFAQISSINKRLIKKEMKVYDFEVFSSNAPHQNFLGGFGGVCCHNSDHQMLLMDKVSEMIKKGEQIKLIVIDSLTAHFRAEYAGRGTLADRQHKINKYIHDLMRLAEQHNLAVYVTNQVMANPAQMFGDPTTPVGGHIVGHACFSQDTKVALADGRNLSFAELIKEHKQGKINFTFTIDRNNKIKIAEIKDPRKTGNAEIMKVILDNGEEIKCTLDHKFMLRDGSYKEAQYLRPNDSLMPLCSGNINKQTLLLPISQNTNHKVFRKEFLKEFADVYDLTIDDTHNFALAAGIFVHNSTYRLYLRRGKQGSRVAKLIDSPNLPDNETVFFVTNKGVVDG